MGVSGWHESGDYDIPDDFDGTNEQATLFYRINSQDGPQTYQRPPQLPEVDNVGEYIFPISSCKCNQYLHRKLEGETLVRT